jgi:hypothetical protein
MRCIELPKSPTPSSPSLIVRGRSRPDDDLILIWHALNVLPDPRALELRRRLDSEMQAHRGIEAERVFADPPTMR